jgi:hypothetical protein
MRTDPFSFRYNRGKDWKGPYQFNGLMDDPNLKGRDCTARTAYVVTGPDSCLLFMSSRGPDEGYVDKTLLPKPPMVERPSGSFRGSCRWRTLTGPSCPRFRG